MRICYHCGRGSSGRPLFCTTCGRSYNIRLCGKLHPNRRNASACSQCGSRDLSLPEEKAPLWFRLLILLSGIIPGCLLLFVSAVYLAYFLYALISDPAGLLIPMLYGLLLGIIWFVWMHIPFVLVRMLRQRRAGK